MKKAVFLLAMLFSIPACLMAQEISFEEYRRQREQEFRQYVAHRDSMLRVYEQRFADYVEERNREYADYLRREWERFQVFQGVAPKDKPKPEEMPAHERPEEEPAERPVDRMQAVDGRVSPRDSFTPPVRVRPEDEDARPTNLRVNFYGRRINIPADRTFRNITSRGTQERDVAAWFERAAGTDYSTTLVAMLEAAEEVGMNDWALFMLAREVGERLAGPDNTAATLYAWFLLQQSGYDIRLGRQNNRLLFLMPFADNVYNTPRLEIDGQHFYAIGADAGQPLTTYRQTMDGAFRVFDMNFYSSPRLAERGAMKTLSFNYRGEEISVQLAYDPVLVAMLADQPQSDVRVYFDSDASVQLVRSVEENLAPLLADLSQRERVSLMLRMVQTSFEYQTDIDQFGMQRFMVPDEVIHYRASDCDDRAALFAWLVRNFAGNQVLAVEYPGHIATAVYFDGEAPGGDYLLYEGKRFVMADPTYINAPLGLTMPDFADMQPEVWLVDADRSFFVRQQEIWDRLFDMGGRRGNNQRDIVFSDRGEIFVTGYFNESFGSGRHRLQGTEDRRTAFVAAMNDDLQLLWARALESGRDATGFSIMMDRRGQVLAGGSFVERLRLDGRELVADGSDPDIFLAAFRRDGQLSWLQKGGLERDHQTNALAYTSHFDLNGRLLGNNYYNDPRSREVGLYMDGDDGIVMTGTFGSTSGLSIHEATVLASEARMDYADMLLHRNNELVGNNVEPSIAGLFAAIQLVKDEGIVFPGTAAQEALLKNNPGFRSRYPNTFANIGKINFLRNKSGLIEIRTENGEDVIFEQLRIRDRSVIRVVSLDNNNEQIDVVERISVGMAPFWFNLNFVRLYHDTGDLMFDYRRNNSRSVMNMQRDILN